MSRSCTILHIMLGMSVTAYYTSKIRHNKTFRVPLLQATTCVDRRRICSRSYSAPIVSDNQVNFWIIHWHTECLIMSYFGDIICHVPLDVVDVWNYDNACIALLCVFIVVVFIK